MNFFLSYMIMEMCMEKDKTLSKKKEKKWGDGVFLSFILRRFKELF